MGMPWWHSVLSPLYHHRNSCSKEWIREKESERESGSRCPVNCGSKRAMLVPISSRYNPLLAKTIAQNELGEYGEINSTPLFGKFWIVAVNWVAPNSTHVENKPFWKEWCGGETRKELGKQWPRKKKPNNKYFLLPRESGYSESRGILLSSSFPLFLSPPPVGIPITEITNTNVFPHRNTFFRHLLWRRNYPN